MSEYPAREKAPALIRAPSAVILDVTRNPFEEEAGSQKTEAGI
jgi:hypothetical protein